MIVGTQRSRITIYLDGCCPKSVEKRISTRPELVWSKGKLLGHGIDSLPAGRPHWFLGKSAFPCSCYTQRGPLSVASPIKKGGPMRNILATMRPRLDTTRGKSQHESVCATDE